MTTPAPIPLPRGRGLGASPDMPIPALGRVPGDRLATAPADAGRPRRHAPIHVAGTTAAAPATGPHDGAGWAERRIDEMESVARIGSYVLDIPSGRWVSSRGLDTIFGIDPAYPRTIGGWAALLHPDDREELTAYLAEALARGRGFDRRYRIRRPDTGEVRWVHGRGTFELDPAGRPLRMLGTISDITDLQRLEVHDRELAQVLEQASDAVIITDRAGTIEYVSPAFERLSGFRRDEVVGRNARILRSGLQTARFYRGMWRRLSRGQSFSATFVNRRKDESLYRVEETISPVQDPEGRIRGYMAVAREVTSLREVTSRLAREVRDRAAVAGALSRLGPRGSVEATASAICDELLGLAGIDLAAVVALHDPGRAVPLAAGGPPGQPMAAGRPLPPDVAAGLHERAGEGTWAERWQPRPADGSFGQAMTEAGIRALAHGPIRYRGRPLGIVIVGTRDEAYARHLVRHRPVIGEFAASAAALLGQPLERERRTEAARERVRRTLGEGGLRPVFQPVVNLASGRPVGYEALTQFASGERPDRVIAQAHSVGLGLEVEAACLAAALAAAEALPRDAWVSLNVSPALVLEERTLAGLLGDRSRRIVLEITEHAVIDDYDALRRAAAGLGPGVSLAVDDAGAGFASLRHVIELRPRFVKLDISLVRHVDRDAVRHAMITGLCQFAARAEVEVIAEGIEDPGELQALRGIDLSLGQGFLLGRPVPVA